MNFPTQTLTPSGFLFTGNVAFYNPGFAPEAQTPTARGAAIVIRRNGETIYSASVLQNVKMNIAEIVKSFAPEFIPADTHSKSGDWLLELEDQSFFQENLYTISIFDDEDEQRCFIPLSGTVSLASIASADAGHDIFTHRFLSQTANFFLTVRTPERTIYIKETELYPLYFINTEGADITVLDPLSDESISASLTAGIYALDIDNARRWFFDTYSCIPSVLEIYKNGAFACRIIITKAEDTLDRCRLRFRNSLGAFEIMELTSVQQWQHSTKDSTNNTYSCYRPDSDDFITCRERQLPHLCLTAKTAPLDDIGICLLNEVLSSDSLVLLDYDDRPLDVIAEAENFIYNRPITTPTIIELKLTVAAPADANFAQIGRNNIFSPQFSKSFK